MEANKSPRCGHPSPTRAYLAEQKHDHAMARGCLRLVGIIVVGYLLHFVLALAAGPS
jgi:hypothetical protein